MISYDTYMVIFALMIQLPPFRNSDPGSHSRHPPPTYNDVRIHFYRGKSSAFSSLVDSRRIVHTHAARRYLLVNVRVRRSPFCGIRNQAIDLGSHEFKPLVHRADRYLVV